MQTYPRYRWVIVGFLWLQQEFALLAYSSLGIMLPAMRDEIGFSSLEAGLLGSTRGLGTVLLILPASLVLARFNAKWVYGALLGLTTLGLLAAGLVQSFLPLYVAFFVYASAASVTQVPMAMLRLQWVRPQEFATVMGLGQSMNASGQSGALIVIPWLMLWLGSWRGIFFGVGAFLLALTLLWIVLGRERKMEQRGAGAERAAWRQVLRRREYLLLGLAMFGGATCWTTTMLFLPSLLLTTRGLDLPTTGLVIGLLPLGGLVACLINGPLSDRLGRRKPIIWPLGFLAPLTFLSLLMPLPLPLLGAAALAAGYCSWGPWPALQTMVYEIPGVKPSEVAVGLSVTQTIQTVGMLLGPVVAGAIAEATGSLAPGLTAMAVLPILIGIVGLLLPETGPAARTCQPQRALL